MSSQLPQSYTKHYLHIYIYTYIYIFIDIDIVCMDVINKELNMVFNCNNYFEVLQLKIKKKQTPRVVPLKIPD